jgi:hypothetical protein
MSTYTFCGLALYLFPDEAELLDLHAKALVVAWTGIDGSVKPILPEYVSRMTGGTYREGRAVLFRDSADTHMVLAYRYGDSAVLVGLVRPDPQPDLASRSPDSLPEAISWRSLFSAGGLGRPYQSAFLHILEGFTSRPDEAGWLSARVSIPTQTVSPLAPTSPDRDSIFDALLKMNEGQVDELLTRTAIARKHLPGGRAELASRAAAILELAEQTPGGLAQLVHGIQKVAGGLIASAAPTALPAESMAYALLADGEYLVDGPEDNRFLHRWIFDLARPLRLALFQGKALRYVRELATAVSLGRPLSADDLASCEQKLKNVNTAAHNFREEWAAAGLGSMVLSALGRHFDHVLAGMLENATAAMRKLAERAATASADSRRRTVPPDLQTHVSPDVLYAPPSSDPLPKVKSISLDELKAYRGEIDLLLVTATRTEKNAVLRRMLPITSRKSILRGASGTSTYYIGRLGEHSVAMTMCRMGSIGTGASKDAVREGIKFWKPRAVIMIGIAFGHDPAKQAIADVLVCSQIISYAEQRIGNRTDFRGPIAEASPLLLDRFRNADHWSFPRPDGTSCQAHEGAACVIG